MKNNVLKTIKPFIAQHEPEILMTMGISGMIFSIIWGIKATGKVVKKVDNKKLELKKEKLTIEEIFKISWKDYLPVVISAGISIPCIIAGNRIANKRNIMLAAAYTLSETALQEYKDTTKTLIGDKKFEKLEEQISDEKIKKTYKEGINNVTLIGDGDSLFFEELSGRYFKTNWNRISKAANELNARAMGDMSGVTTLNDWFDILGLENTLLGETMGWSILDGKSGIIDISIDSVLTPDNEPCGAIRYNTRPKQIYNY